MTALGVSLLLAGAIVVVAEAHFPSLGMLGGPGVVALAVGSVLAVGGLGGGLVLGLIAALAVAGTGLAVTAVSLRQAGSVRRRPIRTGAEGIVGHLGVVRSWGDPTGTVQVDGALWRARLSWHRSVEQPEELNAGDPIVVERLDGLTLTVRPAEDWELV